MIHQSLAIEFQLKTFLAVIEIICQTNCQEKVHLFSFTIFTKLPLLSQKYRRKTFTLKMTTFLLFLHGKMNNISDGNDYLQFFIKISFSVQIHEFSIFFVSLSML